MFNSDGADGWTISPPTSESQFAERRGELTQFHIHIPVTPVHADAVNESINYGGSVGRT